MLGPFIRTSCPESSDASLAILQNMLTLMIFLSEAQSSDAGTVHQNFLSRIFRCVFGNSSEHADADDLIVRSTIFRCWDRSSELPVQNLQMRLWQFFRTC